MLTALQILHEQILNLDNTQGKEAQVGYDVSVCKINKVTSTVDEFGKVLKDKTILPPQEEVEETEIDGKKGWFLEPGTYDFILNEGCNIPANRVGKMVQRSSLMRNGTIIASSIFDPGFKSEKMGTYGIVTLPIFIEKNSRIAQMYFEECDEVALENLYNGQFNNDQQRSLK